MRWRNKGLLPIAMEINHKYAAEIDMWSTCWIFSSGHKIGIDVTSSSSFMYLPNPNTGLPLEPDGIWPQGGEVYKGINITATNTVLLGLSSISLPLVHKADLPIIHPLLIPVPKPPPHDEELERLGREAMC